MMAKLKAGILGAGEMGTKHAGNLDSIADVDVVAVCANSTSSAKGLADKITGGKTRAYDDFDQMLQGSQLDLLYVCIPPHAHQGEVEKAAEAGINLFLEKPIARTKEKARSMVDAIDKAGVISQVGFHYRFSTPIQKLKSMIESGKAKRPTLLQGSYFCNSLHSDWWRDYEKSRGQIYEQIIHLYDLALFLFGEVDSASGLMGNLCHQEVEGYSIEDTSASLIKFSSGAIGSIVGSNCAIPGKWEKGLTVVCENVTAKFNSPERAKFVYTDKSPVKEEEVRSDQDLFVKETEEFVNAIKEDRDSSVPVEEGLKATELVTEIMESADKVGIKE